MFGIYNTNKLYLADIYSDYEFKGTTVVRTSFEEYDEYIDIYSKYKYDTNQYSDLYIKNIVPLAHKLPKKYMTSKEICENIEKLKVKSNA